MANRWSEVIWERSVPLFRAIVAHPFLTGLADGTLPEATFRFYVEQDSLYLQDFSRGLAVLGAGASTPDELALFCAHASNAVAVEKALHAGFLKNWADSRATVEAEPTTVLYTSWLLRAAYERPFPEALAAFLPCYKVYLEVGRALVPQGSPNALYQRWIDTYAGDEFAGFVAEVMAVADRAAVAASAATQEAMDQAFRQGCRMEYSFWDSAWTQTRWPLSLESGTPNT